MLSRRLLLQRAAPLPLAGLVRRHRPSAAAVGLAARVGSSRGLHATGPASSRDLYEVLGLPKTASNGEIKRKYYEKAKAHHPDTNKGDPEAAKKFAEATEAYEVLSDAEKRKAYDTFGHAGVNGGAGDGGSGPGGFGQGGFRAGPGGFQWQFRGGNPNEVDFDDLLSQLFGSDGRRAQRGPRRGRDIQVRRQASLHRHLAALAPSPAPHPVAPRPFSHCIRLHLSSPCLPFHHFPHPPFTTPLPPPKKWRQTSVRLDLEEVATGCSKTVSWRSSDGARSVDVQIPAGVDSGMSVRVRGKGEAGAAGPGDLFIEIKVQEHPIFVRDGFDVHVMVRTRPGGRVFVLFCFLGGEAA